MDPVTLAATATSVMTFFLLNSAEAFVKEFGKDSYTQTKKLKDWLWSKIKHSGDKKVQQAAQAFEGDPNTYKEAMGKALAEYLKQHLREAEELTRQVRPIQGVGSKYVIHITGGSVYGMTTGDHATTTNTFNFTNGKPDKS